MCLWISPGAGPCASSPISWTWPAQIPKGGPLSGHPGILGLALVIPGWEPVAFLGWPNPGGTVDGSAGPAHCPEGLAGVVNQVLGSPGKAAPGVHFPPRVAVPKGLGPFPGKQRTGRGYWGNLGGPKEGEPWGGIPGQFGTGSLFHPWGFLGPFGPALGPRERAPGVLKPFFGFPPLGAFAPG